MATKTPNTNPFEVVSNDTPDTVETDDNDTNLTEVEQTVEAKDEAREPLSLGEAAATSLNVDHDQAALDGMTDDDMTKVKFVGMTKDALDVDIHIGQEMTFLVKATCTGTGQEQMNDGHVRSFVKMKVDNITIE